MSKSKSKKDPPGSPKPGEPRSEAEKALRESEERFRSLVEMTSDWIWMVDREGFYTYASPKVKDLLGYEPQEVIGRSPFDFMPPEEQERVSRVFLETIKSRKPFTRLENVNLHKDGRRVVLESSGVPIVDGHGNLLGYRGIDRDITDRKQAEETLRESEERYRALVETTGTGFVIIDVEGSVVDANAEYVRLAGRGDLTEIRGRSVVEWTADYHKERNSAAVRQCVKEGHIRNLEIDYVDAQGNVTPIEVNATVVESGGTRRILTLCRDITTRKRAQEALRETNEYLESLLNYASAPIIVWDPQFRISRFNHAFESLTGRRADEVIGESVEILFPPPLWKGRWNASRKRCRASAGRPSRSVSSISTGPSAPPFGTQPRFSLLAGRPPWP